MLKQINIITGLPGSGKSHYLKDKHGFILDDEKDFLSLPDYQNIHYKALYISHPMLCLKKYQDRLIEKIIKKYGNVQIKFFCFENKPQQCLDNANKRDKKVRPSIKLLCNNYYFPEQHTLLKVYHHLNMNRQNKIK